MKLRGSDSTSHKSILASLCFCDSKGFNAKILKVFLLIDLNESPIWKYLLHTPGNYKRC